MPKRMTMVWIMIVMMISSQGTSNASLLPETDNRIYVIGGDENFPPYEYVVESEGRQVYRGFNVDIMKAIALETGIEIELRPMSWAKTLKALDDRELDAIQGMKYNPNRAEKYDFSTEYLISSQAIFVRNDTYISGLDDLVGHRIAVQEGDIAHQQLKNNPVYHLVPVPDQLDAFQLLLDNEVIAVICNKLVGRHILQRSNKVREVKTVGPDIDPARYAVAVRKGDTPLLETINRGILGIKRNGTYDKIYAKWFGEQLDYPPGYYKDRLFIALSVLGALGFVVVFLSYMSYVLRREVAKRTEQIAEINRALVEKNEYIRQENLYKENILNSSYSGIVTVDRTGRIGFANNYAKEYFPANHLVGAHFSQTPLAQFFADSFETTLQERQAVCGEKEIGGTHLEFTISVLRQKEEIGGALLTFRDVTNERRMQEQLNRKDKMESLGNLVAGIAHEIRTPLTSIKTFAELLPNKYDNPLFRSTFGQYVPQEVDRLNTLVNDLLDYARPRQPFFTVINLQQLLQGIMPLFSGCLNRERSLLVDIPAAAEIYADKQQIQQVLINILLNAIEARINPLDSVIRIYSPDTPDPDKVTLIIEDNGKGLDPGTLSRIFDPFFTTKSNGTGLGLAISYQLIKENHGEIWAENMVTGGARVSLRLPKRSPTGEGHEKDIAG